MKKKVELYTLFWIPSHCLMIVIIEQPVLLKSLGWIQAHYALWWSARDIFLLLKKEVHEGHGGLKMSSTLIDNSLDFASHAYIYASVFILLFDNPVWEIEYEVVRHRRWESTLSSAIIYGCLYCIRLES